MHALKYKLAAAKAAHTACKCLCLAPHPIAVKKAIKRLKHYVETQIPDAFLAYHAQILSDRDAVLAYRAKKAALAQAVTEVQFELYAAQTASDLE